MWISRKEYSLLTELKQAAEQKARIYEGLNHQLTRENRRLLERLLAKENIPLVDSPDNLVRQTMEEAAREVKDEMGELFEDEFGDPVIPNNAKEERKMSEESDRMEMQP